ncbi:unnamed protein product, partial [marine sediment metagenome]
MIFAWASAWLLRRSAVGGALAVGALLTVLDWVNFTAVPIWGTAQSFARPWSQHPGLILFVSFTGITGILFMLGTAQALVVNIIVRPKQRLRLLTAGVAVGLIFLTANVIVRTRPATARLKVAAVGWTSKDLVEYGDVHNRDGFAKLFAQPVAQAAGLGARLIVFPEMGFYLARSNGAELLERFGQIARRHDVFLAIGCFREAEQENRLLFISPQGTIVAEYTKTHLTPFEDSRKGNGRPVIIDVEGVRVGGMICQDDNFTSLSRGYGRRRTSLVAVPTLDWRVVRNVHFQSSIHRAIESRYAIVRAAANGISAIISPMGRVLARRDHFEQGSGAIVAEAPLYADRTFFSILGHWP